MADRTTTTRGTTQARGTTARATTAAPRASRPPAARRTAGTRSVPAVARGRPTRRPERPGHLPRGAANPDRRLRVGLLVFLCVLSLFAGRLFQLQGLEASSLAAQALSTRTVVRELPAHRGDITDVDGAVLATTVERKNVTVDQTIVGLYERRQGDRRVPAGVRGAAQDLAAVLGLPVAQVEATLTGERRFAYVVKDISPEKWREVAALRIPGIFDESAARRTYPSGSVGAAVVGFVGKDGLPLAGVELAQDDVLAGTPGRQVYEKSRDGREIPTELAAQTDPVPGTTVRLTLDRDLQWKAQELLAAQVTATKAEAGYVVVQNPRTGDILALATAPTFDANAPSDADPDDRGNRALLDIFEPGSTSKVVTAAAALDEGVVRADTPMAVADSIRRGGKTFHDSHSHATEQLTFAGVLAQSSNVGTIMAGEQVSPATMSAYMKAFGFGERTGLGLPESPGILADAADWSRSQRYTVLFGQGLAVNAVQAAGVFSTVANGGVRMPARLVDGTTSSDGTVSAAPRSRGKRVVSEQTAATLSRMLENVVGDDGTARRAQIPGYRVAGKTGTAQAPDSSCGCYRGYTASFIGYAPADDPRLVVAVVLQRPRNGYYGGTVAAPVFQKLMSYALAQQGVPPTGTKAPAMPLTPP